MWREGAGGTRSRRGEEAEDNVVPDIAVVLPDRLHLATGRAFSGTPNIAIEIVSDSSRTLDYVQKRYLYERTGAQEYWIVDRFVRRVEVWRFTGDHPTSVSYSDGDILTTPLLPDLAIPIHELWPCPVSRTGPVVSRRDIPTAGAACFVARGPHRGTMAPLT